MFTNVLDGDLLNFLKMVHEHGPEITLELALQLGINPYVILAISSSGLFTEEDLTRRSWRMELTEKGLECLQILEGEIGAS